MDPTVSIIVPVYNCEEYISNCLESILAQTYTNIEIVIVNDGSFDNSEKIVNKFKEQDDRIVYYYQVNSGPSEARNTGISNSRGEYVVFIDSDDTVDKNYVEILLNKMINSGSDFVCCGYKDISEHGVLNYSDFDFDEHVPLHSFMDMVCKGTGGVLWSKIYKKDIIVNHNLKMDKSLFMSEDLVFVLQYASHCRSFATVKEYLYNYNRLNQGSISANISIDYIQNYIAVCKHLERIFHIVDLNRKKVDEILKNRLQGIVIKLAEQQSIHLKVIGMEKAIYNIDQILSTEYIEKYRHAFSSNTFFYKPYIFLLKNKFIRTSVIYGVYLNILRGLKRKLNKRKQVSL